MEFSKAMKRTLKVITFAAALFVLTVSCHSLKEKSVFEKINVDKKPFIGFNDRSGSKVNLLNTEESGQEKILDWSATYEQ